MAENTKTISVRIPFEWYEEILVEVNNQKMSITDWMILQFVIAKKSKKQGEILNNLIIELEKVQVMAKEILYCPIK